MILEALTLLLAVFLIMVILRATRHLADEMAEYSRLPLAVSIFIAIWLIYLSVLSYTGVLGDFTMPPKLPLLVIMPLFILITITLFNKATADFAGITSVSWLIYIQSFRIIVELIIWGAHKQGVLPQTVTFEGYNYDVFVGLTAIPLAYYARHGKAGPVLLLCWNIAGLLILANTVRLFITTAYFPLELGYEISRVDLRFVRLPFLLIAGFFMPLAVFIHALSIKQLIGRP